MKTLAERLNPARLYACATSDAQGPGPPSRRARPTENSTRSPGSGLRMPRVHTESAKGQSSPKAVFHRRTERALIVHLSDARPVTRDLCFFLASQEQRPVAWAGCRTGPLSKWARTLP